jgi:hypothetical protein
LYPKTVNAVLTEPRISIERVARDLVCSLADCENLEPQRVVDLEGRAACLILVWDATQGMPSAGIARQRRSSGGRIACKVDVTETIRTAGRPITLKEVVKALREAGKSHGQGTVAKALADLTSIGELVNLKDKKGYRFPHWLRQKRSRSLFE